MWRRRGSGHSGGPENRRVQWPEVDRRVPAWEMVQALTPHIGLNVGETDLLTPGFRDDRVREKKS